MMRSTFSTVLVTALAAAVCHAQVPYQHLVVTASGLPRDTGAYFVDPTRGDATPLLGMDTQ